MARQVNFGNAISEANRCPVLCYRVRKAAMERYEDRCTKHNQQPLNEPPPPSRTRSHSTPPRQSDGYTQAFAQKFAEQVKRHLVAKSRSASPHRYSVACSFGIRNVSTAIACKSEGPELRYPAPDKTLETCLRARERAEKFVRLVSNVSHPFEPSVSRRNYIPSNYGRWHGPLRPRPASTIFWPPKASFFAHFVISSVGHRCRQPP